MITLGGGGVGLEMIISIDRNSITIGDLDLDGKEEAVFIFSEYLKTIEKAEQLQYKLDTQQMSHGDRGPV